MSRKVQHTFATHTCHLTSRLYHREKHSGVDRDWSSIDDHVGRCCLRRRDYEASLLLAIRMVHEDALPTSLMETISVLTVKTMIGSVCRRRLEAYLPLAVRSNEERIACLQ